MAWSHGDKFAPIYLVHGENEDSATLPPLPACGERVMAEPCLRHEVRGSNTRRRKRLLLTLTLSPRKSGERELAAAGHNPIPAR